MQPRNSDTPLVVEIRDGALVIEIGLNALAVAAKHCLKLEQWNADKGYLLPEVTDPAAWAKAVLHELRAEEEDGTTRVHRMLDDAMLEAVEQGAEGIRMPGDDADVCPKCEYSVGYCVCGVPPYSGNG